MKGLKYTFITLLLVAFVSKTNAQQDVDFSQYMYNQTIYNPAFTGSEDNLHSTLMYRNQWTGFNGIYPAPRIFSFSSYAAIGGGDNALLDEHPMGIGANVYHETIGFERRLTASGLFAYHTRFGSNSYSKHGALNVFFGMNAGIKQYSMATDLIAKESGDLLLDNLAPSVVVPDIGAGILVKNELFFLGVSAPHLLETNIKYSSYTQLQTKQRRHYYGMAGINFKFKEMDNKLFWIPNVLMKYVPDAPMQMSYNLRVESANHKAWWFGVGYKSNDAATGMFGINLSKNSKDDRKIMLGYAFDYTISDIPSYNNGTHEIMLIFDFNIDKEHRTKE